MIQGRTARIPSSSDEQGLQMVPIPIHQAQIGVVSSAGMTINANSMALVENGTLFLQDGMSNASAYQYIDRKFRRTGTHTMYTILLCEEIMPRLVNVAYSLTMPPLPFLLASPPIYLYLYIITTTQTKCG
jgi:hypothetical protein